MIAERPECYRHAMRTARKKHICCECQGAIQPGETYHYHSGVWDGDPDSFKVCLDCEELRDQLDACATPDEDTPFEGIEEAIEATRHPEDVARLAEIKRKRGATVPKWMMIKGG